MRLSRLFNVVLGALTCALGACEADHPLPPAPVAERAVLSINDGSWYCKQRTRHPNQITDFCNVEVMVDASRIAEWDRIGCFGVFVFTQVIDGKVSQRPMFYFTAVRSWGSHIDKPFKISAFVYFPESYVALDPKLEWYQCQVINASDDMTSPERPLS